MRHSVDAWGSGRRQKCSAAFPLCCVCLQRFVTNGEGNPAVHVQKALLEALRALTERGKSQMDARDEPGSMRKGV